jgi:aminomethyltransferase
MSEPRRTPLYDRHVALGAKIIDFGGWAMPLQYTGILDEHRAVREAVGLFDVSHMGEVSFDGERAGEAVQRVVTNDVGKLADGGAMYTCTLREDGGIVDDCIVYRKSSTSYLIVVNASTTEKDVAHFQEHAGSIARVTDISSSVALIAVQGPHALPLVGTLATRLPIKPFTYVFCGIGDLPVRIARTGYTGEDGVEIFIESARAPELWDRLLLHGKKHGIQPIGLGARDTLRLEARLCLYGNDIDEEHNPLEAGLGWVVKGRGYVGEAAIERARAEGVKRRLVGFKVIGKGIARHGYSIHLPAVAGSNGDQPGAAPGERIGEVTSGTVAPTVGGAVGLGYVPARFAEPGTRLVVDCRGKPAAVELVKGPFYVRPGRSPAGNGAVKPKQETT